MIELAPIFKPGQAVKIQVDRSNNTVPSYFFEKLESGLLRQKDVTLRAFESTSDIYKNKLKGGNGFNTERFNVLKTHMITDHFDGTCGSQTYCRVLRYKVFFTIVNNTTGHIFFKKEYNLSRSLNTKILGQHTEEQKEHELFVAEYFTTKLVNDLFSSKKNASVSYYLGIKNGDQDVGMYDNGEHEKAILYLKNIIASTSDNEQKRRALHNIGANYMKLNDKDKAIEHFDLANSIRESYLTNIALSFLR
ncbi:tetratricopeptide repeat protein [Bacteriovorax sp. DB6_IX]|nr:tetratricopeptide repeat protein [Bacteriovorax sp. DB6_IX]